MPATPRRPIILASAVLAISLAVVTALFLTGTDRQPGGDDVPTVSASSTGPDASAGPDAAAGPDLSHLARRDADDPTALGKQDAPVVLIEYADFQCPFCGRFSRETQPDLIHDYVDKGILRIEWRNFPIFGQESEQAALAAWAAGRQHTFWAFHRLLYSEPRERNSGVFAPNNLIDFAREAGVPDLEKFRRDMSSQAARDAVQRDKEEGYRLGVTSTPAFLVNDTPILGAMPTSTFAKAIEQAAKEAQR